MTVKYSELKLSINNEQSPILINGQEILIKNYLPVDKKAAVVSLSTRGANVNGIIDEILMDAYLHVLIVENYTNIDFSEGELEDILKIFDELQSSGSLDIIIGSLDPSEYNSIFDAAEKTKNAINEYNRSYAAATLSQSEVQALLEKQLGETE